MKNGFIDIHSHILAELDEGAPTLEVSLEMLKIARRDGVAGIVATPHIINGLYENTRATIELAISNFRKQAQFDRIYPGAEIRVDRDLALKVINHELPLLNNGKFLLLELPAQLLPPLIRLESIIRELTENHIIPIIAHPERNIPLSENLGIMERLLRSGALFQVTAMSITEHAYQKSAMKMIKKGYIHVAASDAHDARNRPPILSRGYEMVARKFDRDTADILFIENPSRVVAGQPVHALVTY